jgi:hypothetical protein
MRKLTAIAIATLTAWTLYAAPADDRNWATRVKCELQTAGGESLQTLTWQQGTTPLLSFDQYRQGKELSVTNAANTNVTAILFIGASATNSSYVIVTNYAVVNNGFLFKVPTVGTNTQGNAAGWWYAVYFEQAGSRYWTGNGRLDIIKTTSTADGLAWSAIVPPVVITAIDATNAAQSVVGASGAVWRVEWLAGDTNEAALRAAGDVAGSNYTDAVSAGKISTNDAAYLAACTNSAYYAGLTTYVSNRVTYIGTNAFTGGGGTAQTNVAHNSLLGILGAGTLHVSDIQTNLIAGALQGSNAVTIWGADGFKAGYGSNIAAAVSASVAGDVIAIGPGIFSSGTAALRMNPNTTLVGSGALTTRILAPVTFTGTGIVQPTNNCRIENLSIEADVSHVVAGEYVMAIHIITGSTNVYIRNCNLVGAADGVYMYSAQGVKIENCKIWSAFDGILISSGSVYDVVNCEIIVDATLWPGGAGSIANGVVVVGSTGTVSFCTITVSGSSVENYAVSSAGSVTLNMCVLSSSGSGTVADIYVINGVTTEYGCKYTTQIGAVTHGILRGDGSTITVGGTNLQTLLDGKLNTNGMTDAIHGARGGLNLHNLADANGAGFYSADHYKAVESMKGRTNVWNSAAAGGVTNVILSTPISTLSTGAVVTVTPSQSKRIYQVSASSPITLTNDLTQLAANCTTNYEWETWINYTDTNALSTVWDSRIAWQQQTPDLTVTGLYKFAFSTACGTNIAGRQSYPTVYKTQKIPVGYAVGTSSGTYLVMNRINYTLPALTNSISVIAPDVYPRIISTTLYGGIGTNSVLLSIARGNFYTASATPINTTKEFIEINTTTTVKSFYQPAQTSRNDFDYFVVAHKYVTGAINIPYVDTRPANELETAAYNAGWRP